jgi:Mrp family chromosome partitioning ATPase
MFQSSVPEQMTMSTQVNSLTETQVAASSSGKPQNTRRATKRTVTSTGIPNRPGAEYFDNLLWRIESRRTTRGNGFLVGLTGCDPYSGVSTVAANLAIRAADHGRGPVLLADCNFHRPTLDTLFRSTRTVGVADILAEQAAVDACVQPTPIAGLQLLPAGTTGCLQNLCVAPERIQQLVATLRQRFALVVVDLPAADHLGGTLLLVAALDAALLVIRSEHARAQNALQAVHRLADDRVPLMGTVLTNRHRELPNWLERLV